MPTFSSFIPALLGAGRRLLEMAGLISAAQIHARAFCSLENKLFRLPWVEGVVVHGFAGRRRDGAPRMETPVQVITSAVPDNTMQRAAAEIASSVNSRFGTNLSVRVVGGERLDSVLRPHDSF